MNIRKRSGAFQIEEDPFIKNVQGIGKIYHKVVLLMNFLQTKLQVKSMKIKYYDKYYTINKHRVDTEIVINKFEDKENDYNNFNDIITLFQFIGRKNDNVLLW